MTEQPFDFELLEEVPIRAKDITGLTKGLLTVVGIYGRKNYSNGKKELLWKCECLCGNSTNVTTANLHITSSTKSCGCWKSEVSSKHATLLNTTLHKKHGKSGHHLYDTWRGMVQRITNPDDKDFSNYGGRGVTIDERWLPPAVIGFNNFLEDMEESYVEGYTIDRQNNDLGYCKDNCKWVFYLDQGFNKRSNRKLPNAYPDGNSFKSMFNYLGVHYYVGMFPTEECAFVEAIHFRVKMNFPIPRKLLQLYKEVTGESLG